MNRLQERIAALIAAQGPISVAQYMTLALHDAAGGYYATRQPFGAAGDFTTAPEISQMFGEMLGLWCVQVWHDQGQPKQKRLVELGPGRGTMMADALRAAKVAPEFLLGLDVVLVESSPALQKAQAEKLKDCGVEVRWATHFDDSLTDRPLFLLANEFFDAMPVRQFADRLDIRNLHQRIGRRLDPEEFGGRRDGRAHGVEIGHVDERRRDPVTRQHERQQTLELDDLQSDLVAFGTQQFLFASDDSQRTW